MAHRSLLSVKIFQEPNNKRKIQKKAFIIILSVLSNKKSTKFLLLICAVMFKCSLTIAKISIRIAVEKHFESILYVNKILLQIQKTNSFLLDHCFQNSQGKIVRNRNRQKFHRRHHRRIMQSFETSFLLTIQLN